MEPVKKKRGAPRIDDKEYFEESQKKIAEGKKLLIQMKKDRVDVS